MARGREDEIVIGAKPSCPTGVSSVNTASGGMDNMIGKDFEAGLANLKKLTEK